MAGRPAQREDRNFQISKFSVDKAADAEVVRTHILELCNELTKFCKSSTPHRKAISDALHAIDKRDKESAKKEVVELKTQEKERIYQEHLDSLSLAQQDLKKQTRDANSHIATQRRTAKEKIEQLPLEDQHQHSLATAQDKENRKIEKEHKQELRRKQFAAETAGMSEKEIELWKLRAHFPSKEEK